MKLSLHIVVLIAGAIAIALLADAWHSARHDSEQLAATLKAQNSSIQQAAERENQRDSQLSTALSAIQSQKRAVHTPKQASEQLAAVLPTLPTPQRSALRGVLIPELRIGPLPERDPPDLLRPPIV